MLTLYGLKNCDTCRKALKWLKAEQIAHEFHDLRKDGLDAPILDMWLTQIPADTLVNKRGTTWRGLSEADKADETPAHMRALMLEHEALIKRPIWNIDGQIYIGFHDDVKDIAKG